MFDVAEIRSHFPSLKSGVVFFDGPGGTQVPQATIDAISGYCKTSNANLHGAFITSKRTEETIGAARKAMADFLNARCDEEIVFGQNMTTLTFGFSRAVGRILHPGDEIIVTRLDHDANIAPWVALEEAGAVIRWIDINKEDCTLDMACFDKYLGDKTKLVAVGYSSNAFGTVNDIGEITSRAHEVGALSFVDAVHYVPHRPVDVQEINCDILVCSAYKFFGPHIGVLYGKYDILDKLQAYKVRPAGNLPPHKFETGTQNFEAQAGLIATIDFLSSVGRRYAPELSEDFEHFRGRRLYLKAVMATIDSYEMDLFSSLIDGLQDIQGVEIYGIKEKEKFRYRTPTVAFTMKGFSPRRIAEILAEEGIYVWDGHYYAVEPMMSLGLEKNGGAVRVGLSFYNTREEVDRFISVMNGISKGKIGA